MSESEVERMLEYHNEAFLDLIHEDGLIVMAKGLGLDEIILNVLKVYCDPGNLVVVIGTHGIEEQYFIERLETDGVEHVPKVVTSEYSVNDRQSLYLEGGVLFVTSRILVVDLLTGRIPIESITGMIVLKAHGVLDFCQEAFILRLYRGKNKTGFIKAFSCSPDAFTRGFCQIERVLRNLFLKKLNLWPRFHATISVSLEKHKPETIEIRLSLTKPMLAIQTALLELISVSVKELKKCNPSLDLEEVTAENAISKAFDKIVSHQLDHVWNQLSGKTKQLIHDLKQLRSILFYLTQYDCVTFFTIIENMKMSAKDVSSSSWFYLPSAQSLFHHSKERVYGQIKAPKRPRLAVSEAIDDIPFAKSADELTFEDNPKWLAVQEILQEIQDSISSNDVPCEACHTLLVTADDRTCEQVQEFLYRGSQCLLTRLYNKFLISKGLAPKDLKELAPKKLASTSKPIAEEQSKVTRPQTMTLTQLLKTNGACHRERVQEEAEDSVADLLEPVTDQLVAIRSLKSDGGSYDILRVLEELKPRFIIAYDADVTFVRQIEVYKALHSSIPVVVYFLVYGGSAEEQKYLNILRREKEAFEMLIRQKGNMVIPEDQDGRGEQHVLLDRRVEKASETVNPTGPSTRKGGVEEQKNVQQKIIVDMREFRSELPCLIHARGIDVEPVTLEVGDYILTPDICIERKSVDDLIGSLNGGRLYSQVTAMCRYYKKPMLLIEFNLEKSFSLQGNRAFPNEISIQDFQSKLLLLTIHFPKLRILWCSNPYVTAEIFSEIKAGKEQPNAAQAAAVSLAYSNEMGVETNTSKYNSAPKDFLMLMPGVDSRNCRLLMNRTGSLAELASNWSESQLCDVLETAVSAKSLWESIHNPVKQAGSGNNGQVKGKIGGKWRKH